MRIRRLKSHATLLACSLLFAGCAVDQQDNTDNDPITPLDPQTFEQRIGALEQRLGERCEIQDDALQYQAAQARSLQMEVREVSSLVRHLRTDVERIGAEPTETNAQCSERTEETLQNKEVLGRSEWIGLPDVGTYLKARIDTGANTSSLSAKEITSFERDGEDWVRFKLALSDDEVVVDQVRDNWIEAPVERRVRIVQASGDHARPVVSLLMTLGPIQEQVEFSLNNRSHMGYPVLLGRRFAMDIALIDVSQSYIHPRPEFPGGAPSEQASEDEVGNEEDDPTESNE